MNIAQVKTPSLRRLLIVVVAIYALVLMVPVSLVQFLYDICYGAAESYLDIRAEFVDVWRHIKGAW